MIEKPRTASGRALRLTYNSRYHMRFAAAIAAAYDAEGAIPTPGSGGQQVGEK